MRVRVRVVLGLRGGVHVHVHGVRGIWKVKLKGTPPRTEPYPTSQVNNLPTKASSPVPAASKPKPKLRKTTTVHKTQTTSSSPASPPSPVSSLPPLTTISTAPTVPPVPCSPLPTHAYPSSSATHLPSLTRRTIRSWIFLGSWRRIGGSMRGGMGLLGASSKDRDNRRCRSWMRRRRGGRGRGGGRRGLLGRRFRVWERIRCWSIRLICRRLRSRMIEEVVGCKCDSDAMRDTRRYGDGVLLFSFFPFSFVVLK